MNNQTMSILESYLLYSLNHKKSIKLSDSFHNIGIAVAVLMDLSRAKIIPLKNRVMPQDLNLPEHLQHLTPFNDYLKSRGEQTMVGKAAKVLTTSFNNKVLKKLILSSYKSLEKKEFLTIVNEKKMKVELKNEKVGLFFNDALETLTQKNTSKIDDFLTIDLAKRFVKIQSIWENNSTKNVNQLLNEAAQSDGALNEWLVYQNYLVDYIQKLKARMVLSKSWYFRVLA